MEEHLKDGTPNLVSIRKLAMVSVAEVFRDILPDYAIRHQDYSDVKRKYNLVWLISKYFTVGLNICFFVRRLLSHLRCK